jgi:SpoIIAA-like
MIEIVSGFPDNVVAAVARGHVTRQDYLEILVPAIEKAFSRFARLRCYYELGSTFAGFAPGAMWEDAKIGFGHLAGWERIAVVTDIDWIRHAVAAFRFLMPAEVRVFPSAEAAAARSWIAAA